MYHKILLDSIEKEKNGTDFICVGKDKELLRKMLNEINHATNLRLQYLAELALLTIPGAGKIITGYINGFNSESVKAYLLHHLVADKVKNCAEIVLELYRNFKKSDTYISPPGTPAPSHIYARYDDAIRTLKPKALKAQLLDLATYPRDVCYLPFTMKMLASWRLDGFKTLLFEYASSHGITSDKLEIEQCPESYYPPFSYFVRQMKFTIITCLKYYPSDKTATLIRGYLNDVDDDIRAAAKKSLLQIEKMLGEKIHEPNS